MPELTLFQSTAAKVVGRGYLSSDHLSTATGLDPAITISKDGGNFANPNAGASVMTEIESTGWYYFSLAAEDTATLGPLIIRATHATMDNIEVVYQVVAAGVVLADTQGAITWGQQKIVADAEEEGALHITNSNGDGYGTYVSAALVGAYINGTSIGLYVKGDDYGARLRSTSVPIDPAWSTSAEVTATPQGVWEYATRELTAIDKDNTIIDFDGVTIGNVTNGVALADDAIKAATFDESTAYPIKSADTGSTAIARVGADSDTLETLSDQIDLQAVATELAKVPKSDSTVTWNNTALASINAEVDTALNTAIPGSPTANSINQRIAAIDDLTQAGGAGDLAAILLDTGTTLDDLVDDLETRLTAARAGYLDNLSAGAVAQATELAKVPKSDGAVTWNDTAKATLQAEATDALNAYDPPTKAELDSAVSPLATQTSVNDLPTNAELTTALAAADDAVLAAIAALENLSAAEVNAEVVDALTVDTYAEPGQGAPGATVSLAAKIGYLYKSWRNKKTQTATTRSIYNDAGDTVDQAATDSDDNTTFTKGEIGTGA